MMTEKTTISVLIPKDLVAEADKYGINRSEVSPVIEIIEAPVLISIIAVKPLKSNISLPVSVI